MHKKWRTWGLRVYFILLVLILGLLSGFSFATQSAKFCETCHVMKPQSVTWQVSPHKRVACVTCHVQSGLKSTAVHEGEILRRIYLAVTDRYLLPIQLKNPVPNEVCLQCHTFARTVTPRNDILVPHEKHVQEGVLCVDCHQGIAHGRIAQHQLTIDGDFDKWTPALGKEQMISNNLRIGMKECIQCHEKRGQGPTRCQDCHTSIMTPASHKNPQIWLQNHGPEATQSLVQCDTCHNYTNVDHQKRTDSELDILKYPRQNAFCSDCHLRRPPLHTATWLHDHSQTARIDSKHCLVCHTISEPKPWEKSAKTYCDKCHEGNLGSAFFHGS